MTRSVSDKLLQELYFCREEDGRIGWGSITEKIPNTSTWRNVADHLYEQGLIAKRNGCATHLTSKGVKFCETTSFIDPSTPVIELEDL